MACPIAAQLKRTRRDRERAARARDRENLKKLRAHRNSAKRLKGARVREAIQACRALKVAARARRRARVEELRAAIAAERAAERSESRRACNALKDRARAKGESSIQRAAMALAAERQHQEHLRRYTQRPSIAAPDKRRRIDALHESDSQVENNLSEELIPVWRVVKRRIAATAYRSRTESFLEWVESHRAEVRRILDAQIDRDVADLVAHEAELRERMRSPRRYKRMSDEALGAAAAAVVPF